MKYLSAFTLLILLYSCSAQVEPIEKTPLQEEKEGKPTSSVDLYFIKYKQDSLKSESIGSVSNGSLKNGTLLPFSGNNYQYFDTTSYLAGRCFMHRSVAQILTEAYVQMETLAPNRQFRLMECANHHGGRLYPHRTHQNGLSVDLMMPKLKDGKPCYLLDDEGAQHYFLTFDKNGRYSENPEIVIDFDMIALHLIQLHKAAKKNGLRIKKVIINTDLKDELFASKHGKELKETGMYIVRNLTPLINAIHDDHYHVDFELLR